jgi:hypothetical protein
MSDLLTHMSIAQAGILKRTLDLVPPRVDYTTCRSFFHFAALAVILGANLSNGLARRGEEVRGLLGTVVAPMTV